MKRKFFILVIFVSFFSSLSAKAESDTPTDTAKVDFTRDIRPILSNKCFRCHGPDATNQKSDYRLDTFELATAEVNGVQGIVPGNLEDSEVHWRIHSTDPIDIMPPPEAKMPMTKEEIRLIDLWIEQGGTFAPHWAYESVDDDVSIPSDASDSANPIDDFVAKQLDQAGLQMAPETSREKWLRRVTFDLTGLPPTIDGLESFLADKRPDDLAFADVVDRLLSSTSYAERMTSEWMDVARYSDTFGFQVDRPRRVWPWRDWVISAFQQNMPYDEFATLQLAGDLIETPTVESRLATTFNRLHPQKVEGGSVPEEFRIEYISDRTHTYGTAFLALTFECARCHDHKYDPITAKDYYQMSAFFANIEEAGLYSFFTDSTPTPTLNLPTETQAEEKTSLTKRLEQNSARLMAEMAKARKNAKPEAQVAVPTPVAHLSFEGTRSEAMKSEFGEVDGKPLKLTSNAENKLVSGIENGQALSFTGDHGTYIKTGDFSRYDDFSIAAWIKPNKHHERAFIFGRSKAWTDSASRGYELLLEDGRLSVGIIHFYPGNAIRVRATEEIPVDQWSHVTITYDGSSTAAGVKLFVRGKPIPVEVIHDSLTREIKMKQADSILLGKRMRDKGFAGGAIDEFSVFDQELSEADVQAYFAGSNTRAGTVDDIIRQRPRIKNLLKEQASLRKELANLEDSIEQIMVMEELETPRTSHLLDRGLYSNKGEIVTANTPEWLNPFPGGAPKNRLGLAKWTFDRKNPLTARATVNRYWQMFFGTGLVATSEDFGSQGRLPTHPDLLDWLADGFMDNGWDLHWLFKTITLSDTYRRSSIAADERTLEEDPENLLLARFPATRLTAEMLRDGALATSGLLVSQVGGEPVKPYDLSVSFKPATPSKGDGLYRRSLYTYWHQTAPSPMMTTLDASKRDICRVRLERTNSPLQSLILLNSPQFVEAQVTIAENLTSKFGPAESSQLIEQACKLLVGRAPDERERHILSSLYEEQLELYEQTPSLSEDLLKKADTENKTPLERARIAAVAQLSAALMSFDESLTKR